MHKQLSYILVIAAILLLPGCSGKKKAQVKVPRIGQTETGIASWYGHPYHGRRAANGEIYDMEKLTAAHRTLPFGTCVEVRNLANDKTVTLRITDRGPFVDGRIIDLSHRGARILDIVRPGTARVRLTIVAPPDIVTASEIYAVQIGAFQDRRKAEALQRNLKSRFGRARLVARQGETTLWRVLVGEEQTIDGARVLQERLTEEHKAAFVVRVDDDGAIAAGSSAASR